MKSDVLYKIEYYNRAQDDYYSLVEESLKAAIETAKTISGLIEMRDVRLYEIKEIKYQ